MSSACFESEGSFSGRWLYMQLCYSIYGAKQNRYCPTDKAKYTNVSA